MILRDKVALITGGARIGVTVAEEMARRGCDVLLTYRRSRPQAEDGAARVRTMGRRAEITKADMTRLPDIRRTIGVLKKKFGRLDVLVNMVSIYDETPWSSLTEKRWQVDLDSNLKSAYLTVLEAAPLLKKSGGRVINFSDWVAASGRPRYKGYVPYFAAKTGVVGLTQAQALELAPEVLVNAIAPGPILPPKRLSAAATREVEKTTPLKRWGGAQEIAKAVAFLCETEFITGECLRVDGGRHLF